MFVCGSDITALLAHSIHVALSIRDERKHYAMKICALVKSFSGKGDASQLKKIQYFFQSKSYLQSYSQSFKFSPSQNKHLLKNEINYIKMEQREYASKTVGTPFQVT